MFVLCCKCDQSWHLLYEKSSIAFSGINCKYCLVDLKVMGLKKDRKGRSVYITTVEDPSLYEFKKVQHGQENLKLST